MKLDKVRFKGPSVKYEDHFAQGVRQVVTQLITDKEEANMVFVGGEKDGGPIFLCAKYEMEDLVDAATGEVDGHMWNIWLSDLLIDAELIPSYVALTVPVCVTRYEGDFGKADFYAIHEMTWCRHDRSLTPAEEIEEEQGQYAIRRYCAPENDGILEEMSNIARDYVLRKG